VLADDVFINIHSLYLLGVLNLHLLIFAICERNVLVLVHTIIWNFNGISVYFLLTLPLMLLPCCFGRVENLKWIFQSPQRLCTIESRR